MPGDRRPGGRQGEGRVTQQHGKDIDQQQTQHKNRDRYADVGPDHGRHVNTRVAPQRRNQSGRDADRDGQKHGRHPQFDRHRQTFGQHQRNRATEADGVAEIAAQDVAHVDDKLNRQRTVQTESLVKPRTGLLRRFLSQHGRTRIAGDHTCKHKGDDKNRQ